ncbi:YraN family protein [Camelimonas abortus]|uniref:UPF0102 protein ACFOEX_03110 n=1 Tax=Camelimonas abortus TaxID=1017184 RepID=A0ABV7LBU6_9HYPH
MAPLVRRSAPARRRPGDSAARGLRAETVAAWLLRLKGYRILARRYRAGAGEIDLIARRGAVIALVEVKTRRRMDDAFAAISAGKRRRIASAAAVWLARNPRFAGHTLRLDAVFVGDLSWRALRAGAVRLPVHVADVAPLALYA